MGNRELSIIANDNNDDFISIKSLIYTIRNQQVMLDNDLAELYQVETGRLNEAVKRNIKRFPEGFRFQLTKKEYELLISQFAISNKVDNDGRGGRRKMPYAYTEHGIAMLSAILRSDIAISVSVRIIESFVEMRRYMASTTLLYERLNTVEMRQLNYQKQTDERFDKVFECISANEDVEQRVFFDGQIYDAFSIIANLINRADSNIILIDNYVDINTLNLLAKKKDGVTVIIYTLDDSKLSEADIKTFNAQYPQLNIKYTNKFHDRFMIVDNKSGYHIGASIKDAGKKCFAINLIQDISIIQDIIQKLKT